MNKFFKKAAPPTKFKKKIISLQIYSFPPQVEHNYFNTRLWMLSDLLTQGKGHASELLVP